MSFSVKGARWALFKISPGSSSGTYCTPLPILQAPSTLGSPCILLFRAHIFLSVKWLLRYYHIWLDFAKSYSPQTESWLWDQPMAVAIHLASNTEVMGGCTVEEECPPRWATSPQHDECYPRLPDSEMSHSRRQ